MKSRDSGQRGKLIVAAIAVTVSFLAAAITVSFFATAVTVPFSAAAIAFRFPPWRLSVYSFAIGLQLPRPPLRTLYTAVMAPSMMKSCFKADSNRNSNGRISNTPVYVPSLLTM